MSAKLESRWTSGGVGVGLAFISMGKEDDLFYKDAEFTHWKQVNDSYAPYQMAMMYHPMTNVGLGNRMSCELSKSADFLWKTYWFGFYPGMRPNTGITSCSYVNAVSYYTIKSLVMKIGNHNLFEITGTMMLLMTELNGLLGDLSELVGYNKSKAQLIVDSQRTRVLAAPLCGLPFQEEPDTAFNSGSITFHSINFIVSSRTLSECYINWDGTGGLNPVPYNISTGALLDAGKDFDFGLACRMVWVSKAEREPLVYGFNETIFQEFLQGGEMSVPAKASDDTVKLEVDMKGPVTFMVLIVQAESDIALGNWTKLCDDNGEDYVKEFMLITGSAAREDGLPAIFSRSAKVLDHFRVATNRYAYIFSFQINHQSRQHSGHQTMTNIEKKRVDVTLAAHASQDLHLTVYYAAYNGWYTQKGTGGKVWGE